MNKNLVQINDNYGIVSDEQGNINIVTKENAGYELKDILKKENELEKTSINLKKEKEALQHNKTHAIYREIITVFTIISEIFLYIELRPLVHIKGLLTLLGALYVFGKICNIGLCGTRIGGYFQKKRLKKSINDLEDKLPKLKYELAAIKEKAKYNNSIDNNSIENTKYKYIPKHITHSEVPASIKVHCLTK